MKPRTRSHIIAFASGAICTIIGSCSVRESQPRPRLYEVTHYTVHGALTYKSMDGRLEYVDGGVRFRNSDSGEMLTLLGDMAVEEVGR